MHFWCNTSIKPANRKKRTKTKTQTVYKVVFSPSNRSIYVVIKKTKINKQKPPQTNKQKQPREAFKKPTKTNL